MSARRGALAAGLPAAVLAAALLAGAPGARAQEVLPPPPVIGDSFLPFRLTLRTGAAGLSGSLGDFMEGGRYLAADLAVPVGHMWAVDIPVTILHHRDLKHPLRFPYTDDVTHDPGYADAQGYCNSIGLGLSWEPRLDLERETRTGVWRLEPSLRAGWSRVFVGWEPLVEGGGGASSDYKANFHFASQSGWGPYGGAALNLVHYSDGDITVLGLGVGLDVQHVSVDGDELLPAGTSVSGTLTGISLRIFAGSR
ncbi:MAG TPA: hypothetical protein VMS93_10300 [Candidatus Saccharimonadales bacterium]|nr:hypothetical protein [Candidatus Saccharimonadales bacterium]